MNSSDITAAQWEKVAIGINREVRFLRQLVQRMNARLFPQDDPLRIAVESAIEAAERILELARPCWPKSEMEWPAIPEHDEMSARSAAEVERANKSRRWKR